MNHHPAQSQEASYQTREEHPVSVLLTEVSHHLQLRRGIRSPP